MLSNLIPKYDAEAFDAIHQASSFLPSEENYDTVQCILHVILVITIFHLCLLHAIKFWWNEKIISPGTRKASYQITNLLVNLTLGCLGIYYQSRYIKWDAPITDKIIGHEHLKIFSVGQIGYQLWALPIGIIYIGEKQSMIIHHLAVICVCTVSGKQDVCVCCHLVSNNCTNSNINLQPLYTVDSDTIRLTFMD